MTPGAVALESAPVQRTSSGSNQFKLLTLGALLLLIGFLIWWPTTILDLSLQMLCNLSTLCVVFGMYAVLHITGKKFSSPSLVYLGVLGVFHFGLTLVFGLGLPISDEHLYHLNQWFYSFDLMQAILITNIGFLATCLGVVLGSFQKQTAFTDIADLPAFDQILKWVGCILTVGCIGGWFLIVLASGGPKLLVASYETFLKATGNTSIYWTYYGLGLGMTFLAASLPSSLRTTGFVFFGIWAMVALPIGLRGEVLFPALVAGVVISITFREALSPKTLVIGVIGLLFMISALRGIRQYGIEGVPLSEITSTPVDALVELGSSLRPVSTVVTWTETGEPFLDGATYWAPFERMFARLYPGISVPEAQDDPRIMNAVVENRVGPIGFSPIAEGYINFGLSGVFGFMLLMGWLLSRCDSWTGNQFSAAFLGVVYLPLLIQIRNSFVAVPAQIIGGMILVFLMFFIARLVSRHRLGITLPLVLKKVNYEPVN